MHLLQFCTKWSIILVANTTKSEGSSAICGSVPEKVGSTDPLDPVAPRPLFGSTPKWNCLLLVRHPTSQKIFMKIRRQLLEWSAKFVLVPLSRDGKNSLKIPGSVPWSGSPVKSSRFSQIPPCKISSNSSTTFLNYYANGQTSKGEKQPPWRKNQYDE